MSIQPYRSTVVRSWNAVSRLLEGGSAPVISTQALLSRAMRTCPEAGEFQLELRTALSTLVSALNETAALHPFGRYYVTQLLTGLLTNRRRLFKLWTEQPAILTTPVSRPLIILGLPRSGTSFLFNLLANDPAHRYLTNWETTVSQIPPRTPRAERLQDPRRRTGTALMWFQRYLAPQLEQIHEFHLDGPEECTPLLMQGFDTQALAGMFNVPAYSHWLNEVDHLPTYRHHKRILQTLQSSYPGERWLLKSPDHLAAIPEILQVYPDACLVHLHRDPVQSVSSWASLNAAFRGICSERIDEAELGTQILDRLATDMDAYLKAREVAAPERFLDLPYKRLIAEPMATVERIYAHFGLEFTLEAREQILTFLNADREKSRSHRYTPEAFGLNATQIRERFSAYMQGFEIEAPH